MIPKIIWQTYKDPFNKLPQYAKDCAQTWKDLNPEYKYMYMDDSECRDFILYEYGEYWLSIFNSCPVGVMRGDLWRYLVIYKYGGVYADLDTLCKKPINSWIKNEYSLNICMDDDNYNYAQLAFAAESNDKTIGICLDLIKHAFINPDYLDKDFVHNLTGVNIWTKAIQIGYEKNNSIYCYKDESSMLFHNDAIVHLVASKNWSTEGYVQWQPLVKQMFRDQNDS